MPNPTSAPDPQPRRASTLRVAAIFAMAILLTGAVAFLVARGASDSPPPSPGSAAIVPPADPMPWEDVTWARVPDDGHAMSGPLGQWIDSIVVGPRGGLIAEGMTSVGVPGSERNLGTIWISETGQTWRPIVLDAGGRPGDTATVNALAAGPRGAVAWGSVCCGIERPAAWWSADGGVWERVPLGDDFGRDAGVAQVAAGPDGFAAVGMNGDKAAIWTSPDGRSWTPVDAVRAGLVKGSVNSIARDDRGWIAVGTRNDRPSHDGAIWRSRDLDSWRLVGDQAPLKGPEEVEPWEIVPFAGGYLLTGNFGSHDDRLQCEQQQGLGDGQVAATGRLLEVDCGWGTESHWWSADGERWQLLPPLHEQPGQPPLPVTRADGRGLLGWGPIRAGGPGLVTIGYEIAGRNGPNDVTAIWTSSDGRTWEPVGRAPQFPAGTYPSSMAVVGRQVVAVGYADDPNPQNQGSTQDGVVFIGTILP